MDYSQAESLVLQTKEIIDAKRGLQIRQKGEADFVTDVDLAISSFLKQHLYELYPKPRFFPKRTGAACATTAGSWIRSTELRT